MFRILLAALAAVWLAVPAAAGPVHYDLRSDAAVCITFQDPDPFDCYATLSFTLDTKDIGRIVHMDKDPGNFGGSLDIRDPEGNILESGPVTTDWETYIDGIPYCATTCARAQMAADFSLESLAFIFAAAGPFVPMNVSGDLVGFSTYAGGRLDIWSQGTWASITVDASAVVPLPASGLALVTALLGLAWRRKR